VRLLDTNGFANAHMRPFSANTGQVFVKIGRERWPAGQAVSDASTVEQIKVVRGSCPTLCVHPRCLRANGAPKPVSVGAVCPGRLGQCTASARLDDVQTRGEGRLRSGGRRKTSTLTICGRNKVCPTLYPIAKHLEFLNRVSLRDKTKILLAKPTPAIVWGSSET
jgi:hypothetical protein